MRLFLERFSHLTVGDLKKSVIDQRVEYGNALT